MTTVTYTDTTGNTNTNNNTIIVTSKEEIKMMGGNISNSNNNSNSNRDSNNNKITRTIIEKPPRIMQISQNTWERLRNHSRYYCGEEDNVNSYEEMIIKLLDFFEERYEYEYNNDDNYHIEIE